MQLVQTKTTTIPAYPQLFGRFTGHPSRALRRRMRTPERISTSEWARRYRRVTEIDSAPGAWDESLLPHTVEIMDKISQPGTREVYICMPERGGKTQILLNAAAHTIDQGSKSGNIFWLLPTEQEAKKAMAERIIPMIKAKDDLGRPGRLARYLSRYDDDTKRGAIRFNHGIRLFPAWSNSPASLASYFGVLNIADEIDKFEESNKEGTSSLTQLEKRGRDDRSKSKNIYASTPGKNRRIYTLATEEAQQVRQYHLRCIDCSAWIIPDETNLDITEKATVKDVEIGGCSIACPECGAIMGEEDRGAAYRSGRWIVTKGAEVKNPTSFGYHMSAFCLPMVPLKEIAAAYLRAEQGANVSKVAFANGYKVCDYDSVKATEDYKDILALCDDRPRDVVPDDSAALVVEVDTQQSGFYYEVFAVGYLTAAGSVKSSLVSKGYLLSFSDLVVLGQRTWHSPNGRTFNIISGLIDSGGTRKAGTPAKHSRTKEVYEFCKANPLFKPVKGTGKKSGAPVSHTTLERYPGTSKPIPGGLILTLIDVHYFKDELARRLQVNPNDPGGIVLYSGFTAQQLENPAEGIAPENELIDYAKHMCSEYKNDLGLWEHDRKAGRNDYRDCATYHIYHVDLLTQWGVLTQAEARPRGRRVLSKGVQS